MSTECITLTFTIISTILGFVFTIFGFKSTRDSWYIQSDLNRKNEIAKVALKYRIELLTKTYNSIIRIYTILKENNDSPNPPTKEEQNYIKKSLDSISEGIFLLGTKEEQQICKSIIDDFNNNKNINSENLKALLKLTRNNYRRELGL